MSASVLYDRLRPGRDPNNSSWVIAATDRDWSAATAPGVTYNSARGGLELAPLPRPELAADWLPLEPVTGPDGTLYRTDPARDLLLAKGPCDPDFRAVAGIGGSGFATGRFNTPAGVAVDKRGRIYVADAGNARVQVLDAARGTVIAVLSEGLSLPVHAALDPCGTIYVADAGNGSIHAFSPGFVPLRTMPLVSHDPRSGAPWSAPPRPRPLAVAVLVDGTIVAFDPARAWLWHMTAAGEALTAHPWFDGAPPEGWASAPRRFEAAAEITMGPLDGGVHDLAWHRVLVAAALPEGTSLRVQTFAANQEDAAPLAWAPQAPVQMPRAAADRRGVEYDRMVLSDEQQWRLWRLGRLIRSRPQVARLEGDGPNGAAVLTLPAASSSWVRPGDQLILTTPVGGTARVTVTAATARACELAASGPALGFTAAAALRLIQRDGEALPYGPIDLGFAVDPGLVDIAGANLDGRPETVDLPHELAAFLRPGDVVTFSGQPESSRIELLTLPVDPVTFQLDQDVPGDFSHCTVALETTHGRLAVSEPLPQTGALPAGSQLQIIQDALVESHAAPWIDAAQGMIWLSAPLAASITAQDWTNARFSEPAATDRGRYLWVRLQLSGRPLSAPDGVGPATVASVTPLIRSLRISAPRPSLLHWLPQVFAHRELLDEPPGANFLERFLALFEGQFTRMESALDSVSQLLNPAAADEAWLDFIASWLDLAFDPSWPVARRRQLVIEGAALQAGRGTLAALERYLAIYTGRPATITEGFRRRPPPPMQLGKRGALGVAPLGPDTSDPGRFAHRFTVSVRLPADIDRATATGGVRAIIEAMKPAHALYTLHTGGAGAGGRIGVDMTIGSVVIPGSERPDPCACDPEAPPGPRPQPGHVPGGFRLGGRLGHSGISQTGVQGG